MVTLNRTKRTAEATERCARPVLTMLALGLALALSGCSGPRQEAAGATSPPAAAAKGVTRTPAAAPSRPGSAQINIYTPSTTTSVPIILAAA